MKFWLLFGIVAIAGCVFSQLPGTEAVVGPQQDGSVLLNSGWRLRPAGTQIPLETFPMSTAISPDGRFLLVLNAGYQPPSIQVFDAKSSTFISRTAVPDAWLGLTFAPNGKTVYVGGGSKASVFEFSLSNEGQIAPARAFTIVPENARQPQDFTGDVAFSPDGRLLYAAMVQRDHIAVINPLSGIVIERFRTGRRPYRILFPPDGKSLFVSSWADSTVYQHKPETGERINMLRTGPHPTDMVWRPKQQLGGGEEEGDWSGRLFVAASNTNNVYVFGVREDGTSPLVETISIALTRDQPAGMTPSALALSPDMKRLYVVCSDANTVSVLDVSSSRSVALGLIPTGWYPTAARALAEGRVFILNGRGGRSFPNPNGPKPGWQPASAQESESKPSYVANLQAGSASVVNAPSDAELDAYTGTVLDHSGYRDRWMAQPRAYNVVVPGAGGVKSSIQHVVYIVKEGRTYDQIFGDLGIGRGEPSLTQFPEASTPNHRKLAREFVLLDNFYVNGDVSADGYGWSFAAIAPDYVQKMWPHGAAGRGSLIDPSEDPAALPPAGYLWSNALARGVKVRNYGWWTTNKPSAGKLGEVQIESLRDPALREVTNMAYRGFDLDYLDSDRAKIFLQDLAEFDRTESMPQLIIMRLGNDRTSGMAPGKYSPQAAMADNDLALGMIVDGISHSKFWRSTAIFVLESSAQDGADHVDSHRSPALIISPYTGSRGIDSTMYNTTSMLRTIELILGLRPMTQFDAAALPMATAFQPSPAGGAYVAVRPTHPLNERNHGQ